jgi:hypothetical protein
MVPPNNGMHLAGSFGMANVLRLRNQPIPHGSASGATRGQIMRGGLRERLGRVLNRMGVPGAVKDAHIKDAVTGQEITIQVSELFTRITVDGRDYYFNRTTGKFDGTGSGCGC